MIDEYVEVFKEANRKDLAILKKLHVLWREIMLSGSNEWFNKTRENYDLVYGDDQVQEFREALTKRQTALDHKLRDKFAQFFFDYHFDMMLRDLEKEK